MSLFLHLPNDPRSPSNNSRLCRSCGVHPFTGAARRASQRKQHTHTRGVIIVVLLIINIDIELLQE